MKVLFRLLASVLLGLLCPVSAATVVISPVILEINPQQQLMSVVTLTNQATTPVTFDASLMRWTQQEGRDVLTPTRDAAVNPARFVIAPGRSQVVRIGLRGRSSAPQVTYRLLLRQEPAASGAGEASTGEVQAAIVPTYVFSLPLFVTQSSAQPQVRPRLERGAAGLSLVLSNTGNAHATYRNMNIVADGQPLKLGSVYVLAGSTVRVPLPAPLSALTQAALTLRSSDGRQQERSETLSVPVP